MKQPLLGSLLRRFLRSHSGSPARAKRVLSLPKPVAWPWPSTSLGRPVLLYGDRHSREAVVHRQGFAVLQPVANLKRSLLWGAEFVKQEHCRFTATMANKWADTRVPAPARHGGSHRRFDQWSGGRLVNSLHVDLDSWTLHLFGAGKTSKDFLPCHTTIRCPF